MKYLYGYVGRSMQFLGFVRLRGDYETQLAHEEQLKDRVKNSGYDRPVISNVWHKHARVVYRA